MNGTLLSYITIEAKITNEDVNPGVNEGEFDHESIGNPGNCLIAPDVTVTCEMHEGVLQHKISIYNPNKFSIYVKLTGQSDFTRICSHGTVVFYKDHTAQTVTVTYSKSGSCPASDKHSFDITMDNCLVAPTLSADCGFFGSSYSHIWTLSNPNPVALSYSWTGTSSPSSGSGTIGASGTKTIVTDLDAQTLSLSYTYDGVSYSLATQSAESCLVDLSLTYQCQPDGQHKWVVTNNNVQTQVTFDWWTDPDVGSGSSISLSAGTSKAFYTDSSAHTAYVSYTEAGETHTTSTIAEACILPLELSYECQSNGQHAWSVFNPNASSVTFTWWTDPDIGSGGPMVINASETKLVYMDSEAHIMYVSFTNGGVTYTTQESADACVVKLTLDYECLDDGRHKWTVTSDNPIDLSFTWWTSAPDQGDGTPINISAYGTATFYTDNTSHTAYVQFSFGGESYTTEKEADVCMVVLELDYECLDDGRHEWTATNPNAIGVDFTWWTIPAGQGNSTPTSIPAGGSAIFYTDHTAVEVYASFTYDGTIYTVEDDAGVCILPPDLDYVCHDYNGSHVWTITNPNGSDITYEWVTEDGLQSGGPFTVASGGSENFTTDGTDLKVIVSYFAHGKTISVEKEAESCKSSDMVLTYVCGYASDDDLYWSITNPYNVDLTVKWQVVGDPTETGTVNAIALSDTVFTTSKGNKTVIILVDGYQVGQDDGGEACCIELVLTYQCLGNGEHEWTVTNPNNFDQDFTWSATNSQSGSGTVLANSTTTFITGNSSHTVTMTYHKAPSPEKTNSVIAEACKISTEPEEEEEEVIVTSSQSLSSLSEPDVSICAEWILFHSLRDGNIEIYRLDGIEGQDGYQLINLSQSSAIDSNPSLSFDEQWVAFQSNRDGNYEIYVTDSFGEEQIKLTDQCRGRYQPHVQPR